MSGLRDRFAKGDKVVRVLRIADGIDKRVPCTVVDIGARGVQVRYDGTRETKWAHVSEFSLVEPGKRHRAPRAVVDAEPAVEPAEVTPSVQALPAPESAAAPASAGDVLARLESQGVDVVAFWRALGAGLSERTRRAVTEAEEAQARAEAEVREAEALLADARRTLAGAKARAEDARRELAVVEREMGVVR